MLKCQILFSRKNKKRIAKCRLLIFFFFFFYPGDSVNSVIYYHGNARAIDIFGVNVEWLFGYGLIASYILLIVWLRPHRFLHFTNCMATAPSIPTFY